MYLSQLILNQAGNLQVQRDLASPYEMHRTILRGFPDRDDGGPGRVLFRLEPASDGQSPVVLVQSDKQPNWSRLAGLKGYLVSVQCKAFEVALQPGQRLRFRLRANPTVKKKVDGKRNGARHGILAEADQLAWLGTKGEGCGFGLLESAVRRCVRQVCRNGKGTLVHQAVDYEGILQVQDVEKLQAALAAGIGPAKGFGFGLLSLAPA